MPEFVNPHGYAVHLVGPDGKSIKVKPQQRVVLTEFYDKYAERGFLRRVKSQQIADATPSKLQARIHVNQSRPAPPPTVKATQPITKSKSRDEVARARKIAMAAKAKPKPIIKSQHLRPQKQIVGRVIERDVSDLLKANLEKNNYPISNNIGVGILSYNRESSLRRLVNSIVRNTDLRRTTVFISDDASTDHATQKYLDELSSNPNFVIIRNNKRIGIAGNSNRLLRCLSRFRYGLILNDDVEILNQGWEHFYPTAMERSGLHHLMYRQAGVYGADRGVAASIGGVSCLKVDDKPHGAVLAFDNNFLNTVGYFNEAFGVYGMEHVDWSRRAWEFGLQENGYFDVVGSDSFFHLYSEASAVEDRSKHLQEARSIFANRTTGYIHPTNASSVAEIAYVVPFRNFERTESIKTVMNNLRAQRFPVIHLIMVEQDCESRINLKDYQPINHYLVKAENPLFNKSKAFNFGVSKAPCEMVILHDADMLAQGHYTQVVADTLEDYESCHIGSSVIYTIQEAMERINNTGVVDNGVKCDRVVGYYEGGSIAATKTGYWKCGGFNEDYWGYGCEDCDFYARLSNASKWKEDRVFDFLHLWHSRVNGWNGHHDANKALEQSLKVLPMPLRVEKQYQQLHKLGYAKELTEALS